MKGNSFEDSIVRKEKPTRFTLLAISREQPYADEIKFEGDIKEFDVVLCDNFEEGKKYMETNPESENVQGILLDVKEKPKCPIFDMRDYFFQKHNHIPLVVFGSEDFCKAFVNTFGISQNLVLKDNLQGIFKYFRDELENEEKKIRSQYKAAFDIVSQAYFPKETEKKLLKLLLEVGKVRKDDRNINFDSIGNKTRIIVQEIIKALNEIDSEMVLDLYVEDRIDYSKAMNHMSNREKIPSAIEYVKRGTYIFYLFDFLYKGSSNIILHPYPKKYHWTTCHAPTYDTVHGWQNGLLDLLMWVKYISDRKPVANA